MTRFSRTYFVYGTLRPGGRYWPNVAEFVASYDPALLEGHSLWDLPDGYPAVLPGDGKVFGDLLYIRSGHEQAFTEVADDIEGFDPGDPGSLYLRRPVSIRRMQSPDGIAIPSETYVFNAARRSYLESKGTIVPTGDWREFVATGEGLL